MTVIKPSYKSVVSETAGKTNTCKSSSSAPKVPQNEVNCASVLIRDQHTNSASNARYQQRKQRQRSKFSFVLSNSSIVSTRRRARFAPKSTQFYIENGAVFNKSENYHFTYKSLQSQQRISDDESQSQQFKYKKNQSKQSQQSKRSHVSSKPFGSSRRRRNQSKSSKSNTFNIDSELKLLAKQLQQRCENNPTHTESSGHSNRIKRKNSSYIRVKLARKKYYKQETQSTFAKNHISQNLGTLIQSVISLILFEFMFIFATFLGNFSSILFILCSLLTIFKYHSIARITSCIFNVIKTAKIWFKRICIRNILLDIYFLCVSVIISQWIRYPSIGYFYYGFQGITMFNDDIFVKHSATLNQSNANGINTNTTSGIPTTGITQLGNSENGSNTNGSNTNGNTTSSDSANTNSTNSNTPNNNSTNVNSITGILANFNNNNDDSESDSESDGEFDLNNLADDFNLKEYAKRVYEAGFEKGRKVGEKEGWKLAQKHYKPHFLRIAKIVRDAVGDTTYKDIQCASVQFGKYWQSPYTQLQPLPYLACVKEYEKFILSGAGRFTSNVFQNIKNLEYKGLIMKGDTLYRKDTYVIFSRLKNFKTLAELEGLIIGYVGHDSWSLQWDGESPNAVLSFQTEYMRAMAFDELRFAYEFDVHESKIKPTTVAAFKNVNYAVVELLQVLINVYESNEYAKLHGITHVPVVMILFFDQCIDHTQFMFKPVVPHNNIRSKQSVLKRGATEPQLLGCWFGCENEIEKYFMLLWIQMMYLQEQKEFEVIDDCVPAQVTFPFIQLDHKASGLFTKTVSKDVFAGILSGNIQ